MPEENREEEELNIGGKSGSRSDNTENTAENSAESVQNAIISPREILERESSSEAQFENIELPSKGLYYGWDSGVISVKQMGLKAEKILATQRLAQSGQAIDFLFREHCRFPDGFDSADLLLGDRVFILYYLRGITYGNQYEFAMKCPACDDTNTYEYDISELINTVQYANEELGEEPFKIVLPQLSERYNQEVWVGVRFLRARDTFDILARRRAKNKGFGGRVKSRKSRQAVDPRQQQSENVSIDNALDDQMDKIIVSFMGVQDRIEIRKLIQNMKGRDTATIREWLRDNTPGIDSTVEVTCPSCEQESTVELPITEAFFRPAKR